MRQLAYLGVAALTAVALLGTSCSSDDGEPGTTTTGGASGTGGAASTGTHTGGAASTSTAATGGSTATSTAGGTTGAGGTSSTSTENPAGGTTGVGGTAAGGTAAGGTTADAGPVVPVTGGLPFTGNFFELGDYMGTLWTAVDTGGSEIALATDELCVTGKAVEIGNKTTVLEDGGTKEEPDYSKYWGVNFGFNLNQAAGVDGGDAADPLPADLSGATSITVGLDGATGLILRVQLEVKSTDDAGTATSAYYCASLPAAGATIDLTTLKTNCWSGGNPQTPFDPATMQPSSFAIAVVTKVKVNYDINFCVTDLKFNAD